MEQFGVRLTRRGNLFTGSLGPLPYDLTFVPERWSEAAEGGFNGAAISVAGPVESLRELLNWIGDRVEIVNPSGSVVWIGYIHEIEADLGGPLVTMSVESLVNRCAVRYTLVRPDGTQTAGMTAWAEDSASVARYGKQELIYTLGDVTSVTDAEAARDRILARLASPTPVVDSAGGGTPGATLTCRGLYGALDDVYFTTNRGLAAHDDSGDRDQPLAAAYASAGISFGEYAGGGGSDDVSDSNNGFGSLEEGDVITLSGSSTAALNGTFTVKAVADAGNIELYEFNPDAPIPDVAAGETIYVTLGESLPAYKLAQSFTILSTEGWNAAGVAIRAGRVGAPGDDLRVDLMTDSGGQPGSVVATGYAVSLPWTSVPTEVDWVELTFPNTYQLSYGVTYWIVVYTNVASIEDYYVIKVDEDLGADGEMLVWDGSAWVTRDPDADLPFRVWGASYTTTQLVAAAEMLPDFDGRVIVRQASGVSTRVYRDDDRTALEEVRDMLDLGYSSGARMVARVDETRHLIIEPVAADAENNLILGEDSVLRFAGGMPLEPGRLVAGRYLDVPFLPAINGNVSGGKGVPALFVEHCEYDARAGKLRVRTEGAPDPWGALRRKRG